MAADCLIPEWPAPANVRALQTLRTGGCSRAPWNSLNLGDHVGDDPGRVAFNRASLRERLPAEPLWLSQVHDTAVVDAASAEQRVAADAAVSRRPGSVCAVMTADCLPVLFCDRAGTIVAAAHAGWRGLLDGVLENTVAAMQVPPGDLLAWLGPAIGPQRFEVGDEVRAAFVARNAEAAGCFAAQAEGKWLANIYGLARLRLARLGITQVSGGDACTVSDAERYFSYRRDGTTGRMATLIWLAT
ncbi:peptidoglycan editing factor PgeF [Dechloromonas sp. XY25]|uniref:Purine nucleoside phosphorylase n=1 Tax=Dechloromonas hankyongensis TaxID=2908002 RepID=A0ABS9K2B6_9RHOO|nr:peptidoglycan editing factor PgeF [Dechloromonas hankyongensis]MCG2577324.1 peptidoglycan editing factor PgeF [Dechloromonas hankyongensis]